MDNMYSEAFIWQKFPGPHHLDPVALFARFPLQINAKVNGTHDAIAEFLVNQLLKCRPIDIEHLEMEIQLKFKEEKHFLEAIEQRVGWRIGRWIAFIWHGLKPRLG